MTRLEQQRGSYMQALAEKVHERDRILTLHRRGRIPEAAAEAQLDEIAREEAELRQQCTVLETQKALAESFEAHVTDTRHLLERLQGRVEEIERTNDQTTKRQVIELLVHEICVDTDKDRNLTITITYAFRQPRVAKPTVPAHGVSSGRDRHTYDVS